MLSSLGIWAYQIFIESFFALAFNNSIFIHLSPGWGQRHSLASLGGGRGMCGLTMCVAAALAKSNRDRSEKPEVCEQERSRT